MKKQVSSHLPNYLWVKEDQPGYKLIRGGSSQLSDAEVLSLIIGTGNGQQTSLEIAQNILSEVGNLPDLWKTDYTKFNNFPGMGMTKATAVMAAIELGRRREAAEVFSKKKISSSRDAFELLKPFLGDQPYEKFYIIMLNRANRVLGMVMISEGGISGTVVDPKKIFKIALDNHCSSIILGHNHPSGTIQPSEADQKITKKVKDAGVMLEITVLDHIIVGDDQYYSFADDGVF